MTAPHFSESPKGPGDEEGQELENAPNRRIGPLSDYAGLGEEFYSGNVEELLKQVEVSRNPEEKVNVTEGREKVGKNLQKIDDLIEKEKEKDAALGGVRESLGVPHEGGATLQKLEEAKEHLEQESRDIELAGEFNDILESFDDPSHFSSEDIEHIARTGTKKDGSAIHDRHGKEVRGNIARELAHLYGKGGRHVTWGTTKKLSEMVDKILDEMVISVVKGILQFSSEMQLKLLMVSPVSFQ